MMDWIWTGLVAASILFGVLNGRMAEVSAAALEGAETAVKTCLGLCAGLCLWSGILKLLETGGASAALGRLLRPHCRHGDAQRHAWPHLRPVEISRQDVRIHVAVLLPQPADIVENATPAQPDG